MRRYECVNWHKRTEPAWIHEAKRIGKLAAVHGAWCDAVMCSNPRVFGHETLAERRSAFALHEGLIEAN